MTKRLPPFHGCAHLPGPLTRRFGACWLWLLLLLSTHSVLRAQDDRLYAYQRQIGSYGQGQGQFAAPTSVAVDRDGHLYVADRDNARIQKFTASGSFETMFGSHGTGNGQFMLPTGVAVDKQFNVYVTDKENAEETSYHPYVQRFTSSGTFVSRLGSPGTGNGEFADARRVAIDFNSAIYVDDQFNARIQKFSPAGVFNGKYGSAGNGNGQFRYPYVIDLTSGDQDNVYTLELDRIQKFSRWGQYLAQFGLAGQVSHPAAIAMRGAFFYVADSGNHRILVFNGSGQFVRKIGSFGSGNGEFNTPTDVEFDVWGNLYVADQGNHRIQVFAPQPQISLLRINVGGPALTTTDDYVFQADAYGSGSTRSLSYPHAAIANTTDDRLYQTERVSKVDLDKFRYEFPMRNGSYQVKLHFAETYFRAPGKRVFSVAAEGVPQLTNYDIFADVGANTAVIKTFSTDVSDLLLTLDFSATVNRAKICAIEVIPIISLIEARINCGGPDLIASDGYAYQADFYGVGNTRGITYAHRAIANTVDDQLYQTELVSNVDLGKFRYEIPMINASYQVKLHFAETYFTAPGKRLFSVAAEGVPLLTNYDIFADVGANAAVVKTFFVSVTDNMLTLDFSATVNRAKVCAIEVIFVSQPAARQAVQEQTESGGCLQAWPNPFQESTTLRFQVSQDQVASLELYDSQGRLVQQLFQGAVKASQPYEVTLAGQPLSRGIYLARLVSTQGVSCRKLVLSR